MASLQQLGTSLAIRQIWISYSGFISAVSDCGPRAGFISLLCHNSWFFI